MTMRSMWNGTLSFGMIVIPVKLAPAAGSGDLELHQYHKADGGRVAMKRTCSLDGEEVAWDDTARGWEAGTGQVVLLEKEDFELAYGSRTREMKVLHFTARDSLPRAAHKATYLIEPGTGGGSAYALLAEALKRTGKAAVTTLALSQREVTGLVYTDGEGYLYLDVLHWAADVRKPDFKAPEVASEAQAGLAESYVGVMTEAFDWASREDASAQALENVIRAKAEAGQVVGAPAERKAGSATAPADLEAVLRASVDAAKAAKAVVPASRRRPAPKRAKAGAAA